jgi:ParB/RepB/Spo0J family partition protein
MHTPKTIQQISIEKLLPHPENPNKMGKANFKKLVNHIKESGDYEPIIVRHHPDKPGFYQILNGHHRTQALSTLNYNSADCIIWDVTDEKALMLLATLNRLNGRDEITKRANLVNRLSESFNIKQLTATLPETKQAIEKLKSISTTAATLSPNDYDIPDTLVYIVTAKQKTFVNNIINEAIDPSKGATDPQRKAWALVEILRHAKV